MILLYFLNNFNSDDYFLFSNYYYFLFATQWIQIFLLFLLLLLSYYDDQLFEKIEKFLDYFGWAFSFQNFISFFAVSIFAIAR